LGSHFDDSREDGFENVLKGIEDEGDAGNMNVDEKQVSNESQTRIASESYPGRTHANDKENGRQAIPAHPDGATYTGEFKDGKFHGQGTYTHRDGSKYVGEFKEGHRSGQGTYTWPDGATYTGEFKDGKFHGQGVHTRPDGEKYTGEFTEGKRKMRGSGDPHSI
jgi:hypothetical protein